MTFYNMSIYVSYLGKSLFYNNVELFVDLNECVNDITNRMRGLLSEISVKHPLEKMLNKIDYNISIIPLSDKIPSYKELEERYNHANLQIAKSGETWVDYKCNNIDEFTVADQYNIIYDKDGPHLKKSKYVMYGIYDGAATDWELSEEEKQILG